MTDKLNEIKNILEMIDIKINHIEDMVADNRSIIIKLVKQGNQVVNFLKEIESTVDEQYGLVEKPTFTDNMSTEDNSNKIESIQKLIDDFMDKHEELKDFEKELKKNKDKLTPGTIGES